MVKRDRRTRQFREEQDRAARLDELRVLLADLIHEDPISTAYDLVDLSLSLVANEHPADLPTKQKLADTLIASDDLVEERAMSEQGALTALAMQVQACRVALESIPEADTTDALRENWALLDEFLGTPLKGIFDGAIELGVHPFSVTANMIFIGTIEATKHNVHWSLVAKLLLSSIEHVMKPGRERYYEENLDRAIQAVMDNRGISRERARRFVLRMVDD